MFKTILTARGYELDSFGHVNNAVYLNYLEHARWVLFGNLNLIGVFDKMELLLVVVEVNIRYQREILLHDELEIRTVCRREDPYIIFDQKLIHHESSLTAAKARVRTIFVDKQRISCDIPEEMNVLFKQHGET